MRVKDTENVRLGCMIRPEQAEALDRLRYATDETVSEHVRKAIDLYLAHVGAATPPTTTPQGYHNTNTPGDHNGTV